MTLPQAVVVRGLADARRALGPGRPVTLLSPPGAALYLGPAFWRAMAAAARAEHPDVIAPDILDCADAAGTASAALRLGLTRIVLLPSAPARDAVLRIAAGLGATVLGHPPPAVALAAWLGRPGG